MENQNFDYNLAEQAPQPPTVYPVITNNIKDLEDVKKLLNALGLAMTKEYAEENGLSHLIEVVEPEFKFD